MSGGDHVKEALHASTDRISGVETLESHSCRVIGGPSETSPLIGSSADLGEKSVERKSSYHLLFLKADRKREPTFFG